MIRAAILGSTGYAGMLLMRLLGEHPEVREIYPVSSSKAGTPITETDKGLSSAGLLKSGERYCTAEYALEKSPEVVFSALPHLASIQECRPFMDAKRPAVVIDLSADLRLKHTDLYEKAYKSAPPRPDLLDLRVYGLSELFRKELRTANLIANPGCYPTATLLPLLPVLRKLTPASPVVVNAISGISGAGKKSVPNSMFCSRSENAGAYLPGSTHRHVTEITQFLGEPVKLYFTPHLAPLRRGMAVTTFLELREAVTHNMIEEILHDAYKDSPFISLTGSAIPQTADVHGSNRCDIGWHCEGTTLYLFSAIDNLVKGASGQAVQNMNIRFSLDETQGLRTYGGV